MRKPPVRPHPNRAGNGLCPPVDSALDELLNDSSPAYEPTPYVMDEGDKFQLEVAKRKAPKTARRTEMACKKFWIVWSENGAIMTQTMSRNYPTLSAAKARAKEIAMANPNHVLYVLESCGSFVSQVKEPEYMPDED